MIRRYEPNNPTYMCTKKASVTLRIAVTLTCPTCGEPAANITDVARWGVGVGAGQAFTSVTITRVKRAVPTFCAECGDTFEVDTVQWAEPMTGLLDMDNSGLLVPS